VVHEYNFRDPDFWGRDLWVVESDPFYWRFIQWVLRRGGLFQGLARAALPFFRRHPKRYRSRSEIVMDQFVAHSSHTPPINVRMALLQIPGYFLRRLTNDLNTADERALCRLIRVEM
jgi:hypothetical protein